MQAANEVYFMRPSPSSFVPTEGRRTSMNESYRRSRDRVGASGGAGAQQPQSTHRRTAPKGPDLNGYYVYGPDSRCTRGCPEADAGAVVIPSQAIRTQHTYWICSAQYTPSVP